MPLMPRPAYRLAQHLRWMTLMPLLSAAILTSPLALSATPDTFVAPDLGAGPWDLSTALEQVHVDVLASGLDHPWGMVFLPNGDILVTERAGRLRLMHDGVLDPNPVEGLPDIHSAVFGGLLDIALHPDFANNSLLYFSYSKPDVQDPALATTAVARARWDGARLNDVQDIFVGEAWYSPAISRENGRCCGQPPSDVSYGSRLEFDAEGHLFLTLGDRGWGEMAQEGMVHMGKIVRINDDGSVPADNPFIGQQGYHPTLWTLGHRNPLGLAINPGNGDIWAAEFGPSGGDELNLIQKGANYGWALVSKGVHYSGDLTPLGHDSPPGMEEPVLYWVPSINPGNLAFYNADAFPAWKGNLLMSTLSGSVRRFTFDDNGKPVEAERMLSEIAQRFRDITVGPDGYLYLLTDEPDGVMLQVRPQ